MKQEQKTTKNADKKQAKRQRRELRKRKRVLFARKRQGIIVACVLAVFSACVCLTLASEIVSLVFSNEKIVIGERAQNVLTYTKPASKIARKHLLANLIYGLDLDYDVFQQASLPIGNGDMGLSILGETDVERLVFNEKTLWSGGPVTGQSDYNGDNFTGVGPDGLTENQRFYAIRDALIAGDQKTARKLFENLQGDTSNKGAYLAFGDVLLDFGHKSVKNYQRTLDIDNAIASVSYAYKGTTYTREFFANNPSDVLAIELASQGENLCFSIGFDSKQDGSQVIATQNVLRNFGTLANGLNFFFELKVDANGGRAYADGDRLVVCDTQKAHLYISAATDYKNDFPTYRTGESRDELAQRIDATVSDACDKGYSALKAEHTTDYRNLYDRVAINLGGVKPDFTTDTLVSRYPTVYLKNSHRKYLEQLAYNYGRYLLISSSRANSQLPSNLQGVWNETNEAPWQSDYHINVNLQMNYWLAYNTNLFECAEPLVGYVDGLRKPGRITAKTYTATEEELAHDYPDEYYGFVAHTESNPYGHTTPGSGSYVKALWSPAAVTWLLQNVYEGYEYTLDTDYLARIYPIMKEALRYFERTMVEINGRLVSAPSYSPEHGPITLGNTYEQSLIWQLLVDTIDAAKVLCVDEDKIALWSDMLEKLHPIEIGTGGQIKEWYDETYVLSMGVPLHRHTSHLLGLFPGDLINKDVHPEWLDAARVSLKWRGKETTGWAMGQRINTYARLGDGNAAYDLIAKLFSRGMYSNLFDAHPPFQIDGNFGYTAGVTEMLMQSNLGYVELLPALPDRWAQGEICGIVARGNFEISMKWTDKTVDYATIRSSKGALCTLKLAGADGYKVLKDGVEIPYTCLDGRIVFDTQENGVYQIVKN